jgi:hypothetical protein
MNVLRVLLFQYEFEGYGNQFILCQFCLVNVLILYIEALIFGYLLIQYTIYFLPIWTPSTEELSENSVFLYIIRYNFIVVLIISYVIPSAERDC